MRWRVAGIFIVAYAVVLSNAEGAGQSDMQAKEVAEQFMKAVIKDKDIDGFMKTVDLPFVLHGKKTNDRQDLSQMLHILSKQAPADLDYKFSALVSFGFLTEDCFRESEQTLIKEILDQADSVVLFRAPRRLFGVGVRVRDTKAKVASFFYLSPLALAIAFAERDRGNDDIARAKAIVQETAERFLKAAKAQDLVGLGNLTDLPFYDDGTEIIKNQDRLKTLLKKDWIDFSKDERFPGQVLGAIRYGDWGELFDGKRLHADGVLDKDDWFVIVAQKKNFKSWRWLLIRIRAGTGKVVGVAA